MTRINLDFFAVLSRTASNAPGTSDKPNSPGKGAFRGVMGKKLAAKPDAGQYSSGKDSGKGSNLETQTLQHRESVATQNSANTAKPAPASGRKNAAETASNPAAEAMVDDRLEMAILQSALSKKWTPGQEELVCSTTDSTMPEDGQKQSKAQLFLPFDADFVSQHIASGIFAPGAFAQISEDSAQSGRQQPEEDADAASFTTVEIAKNLGSSGQSSANVPVLEQPVIAVEAPPSLETTESQTMTETVDAPAAAPGNVQVGFQDFLARKMAEPDPDFEQSKISGHDVVEKMETTAVRENTGAVRSSESKLGLGRQASRAESFTAEKPQEPSEATGPISGAQTLVAAKFQEPSEATGPISGAQTLVAAKPQEPSETAGPASGAQTLVAPVVDAAKQSHNAAAGADVAENARVEPAVPVATAAIANPTPAHVPASVSAEPVPDSISGNDNAPLPSRVAPPIEQGADKSLEKGAAELETSAAIRQSRELAQASNLIDDKNSVEPVDEQTTRNAEPAPPAQVSSEKAAFAPREVPVPERAERADLPGAREIHLDPSQNSAQATRSFMATNEPGEHQTAEYASRVFDADSDETAGVVEQGEAAMAAMPRPAAIAPGFGKNRERVLHKVAADRNSSMEQPAIKAGLQSAALPVKPTPTQTQGASADQEVVSGAIEDALRKRGSMNHEKNPDADLKGGISFNSESTQTASVSTAAASEAAMRHGMAARAAERVERLHELAARLDEHVLEMTRGKNNTMTIRLTPPNLGRVALSCREEAGEIRLQIAVENESVRSMLQQQERHLREMLEQSGYKLAQFDVKSEGRGPEHDGQRRQNNATQRRQRVEAAEKAAEETVPIVAQGMLGKESVWFIA